MCIDKADRRAEEDQKPPPDCNCNKSQARPAADTRIRSAIGFFWSLIPSSILQKRWNRPASNVTGVIANTLIGWVSVLLRAGSAAVCAKVLGIPPRWEIQKYRTANVEQVMTFGFLVRSSSDTLNVYAAGVQISTLARAMCANINAQFNFNRKDMTDTEYHKRLSGKIKDSQSCFSKCLDMIARHPAPDSCSVDDASLTNVARTYWRSPGARDMYGD
ncbi:hypothetical protein DFH06DRAFT_1149362 [Mycena polygramma]|nr:hypothetical protein DFH06DRAFT_1149362 [Mycena polygramma]